MGAGAGGQVTCPGLAENAWSLPGLLLQASRRYGLGCPERAQDRSLVGSGQEQTSR